MPFLKLFEAKSITSDTIHGNQESIDRLNAIFSPDVESMEGAAVFYVAKQIGIPFLQVRAISNYVEVRDTSKWQIEKALIALSKTISIIVDNRSNL